MQLIFVFILLTMKFDCVIMHIAKSNFKFIIYDMKFIVNTFCEKKMKFNYIRRCKYAGAEYSAQ